MNSSNNLTISKIYKVIQQTWIDGQMGDYGHETLFEKIYINKEEAHRVFKEKDSKIVGYSRMYNGVYLNEIDVIFNSDGSYQEVTISKNKKFVKIEDPKKF